MRFRGRAAKADTPPGRSFSKRALVRCAMINPDKADPACIFHARLQLHHSAPGNRTVRYGAAVGCFMGWLIAVVIDRRPASTGRVDLCDA